MSRRAGGWIVLVGAAVALAGCTSSGSAGPSATAPQTAAASSGASASAATSVSPSASQSSAATPATTTTSTPASTPGDWPMYHGRPDRAGVSTTMPAVRGTMHVIADLKLDGQVYASPIVANGLTIVATENDTVYAFDRTYHEVWKRHLGSPSPAGERPCGNIDPLGITGTPVYEASTGLVYLSPEYGGPPRHTLVALGVRDGTVRWQRSIDLPGVETKAMQERGALTVSGGRVWVPFGGLAGDCGGYKGRLVATALDGSGAQLEYTVPTAREAGIWTPPGPTLDAAGNLYVAVGNGASGRGDPYDHSDSVLEINTNAHLVDSFSPTTWASDNDADLDLGSQAPALVGPWVFSAGKSGTAYVLRRGRLGGIGGQVSETTVCKSFGGTAVRGDVVFVPCTDGVRAVRIDRSGVMHVVWHAASTVSGSPVVGGGRVWVTDQSDATLHALDPDTGKSLAQVGIGSLSRFATPALSGRDVLVGTDSGLSVVRTS